MGDDAGMRGKQVLVTGATGGIGLVAARELAKKGAKIFAVGRDPGRGERALAEIAAAATGEPPELLLCDFASQRQIRALAAEYKSKHDRLDVLVNNAGATFGERRVTEDGLESHFGVNHIGYFLLTTLLLDVLKVSAPSRIVNVASDAHHWGDLYIDDLQSERGYISMRAYGTSKLANILFTRELARRLEGTGVTANALHPGVVATNFGQSGSPLMRLAVTLGKPFFVSQEKGAETTIYLASSPEVEGVTGEYFAKKRRRRTSSAARDLELARRLWEESERLVARSA